MKSLRQYQFPEGFLWGAATASYQVEGATEADGRKVSIWDTFCSTPGNVKNGASGKDACRHYEKWEEDLDLIKSLGLNTYRFSIAWPRIIPDGRGTVNSKGLDWYERLVDGMLKRGIKPNATLYHWDLPQPLQDQGGWLNRDTATAYADYAVAVLKRLGDRLPMIATHNEPQVFIWCGYASAEHAPGLKLGQAEIMKAIHNVMISHGLGMQAIRAHAPKAKAGIVLAPTGVWPVSQSPQDVAASERHWEDTNDWWVLPLMKGYYPEGSFRRRGADAPEIRSGDMELIAQKLDFLGLNYYTPGRTMHDDGPQGYKVLPRPQDAITADMPGWEVFPACLERLLLQFSHRYPKIPLYITENGLSISADAVGEDGRVHDLKRVDFIKGHLSHALRAIEQGVDLRGYYAWSLMDNFEWGHGYTQRFGITHVDYTTFKRTPKDSAYWYRETVIKNGFEAPETERLPGIHAGLKT